MGAAANQSCLLICFCRTTYSLHCSSFLGLPFRILHIALLKPKTRNYNGDCRQPIDQLHLPQGVAVLVLLVESFQGSHALRASGFVGGELTALGC